MTTRKSDRAGRNLCKKGFRLSETHHKYYVLYVEGKKTPIQTYISQGSKELDDYLLGEMAKQVRLGKKQFLYLIDCPMSGKSTSMF